MAKYLITKDFDWAASGNAVRTFTTGQEHSDLTKDCIEKGKALNAIKLVNEKDS